MKIDTLRELLEDLAKRLDSPEGAHGGGAIALEASVLLQELQHLTEHRTTG